VALANPKIFASYAWSPDRAEQVREICERLVQNGIVCVLDQWNLIEGQDRFDFMEQSVKHPSIAKVLLFSDRTLCREKLEEGAQRENISRLYGTAFGSRRR
jgi:hypothetical protein